jgi:hypothetical protein
MNYQVSRYACLPHLPDYWNYGYGALLEPLHGEIYRNLPKINGL